MSTNSRVDKRSAATKGSTRAWHLITQKKVAAENHAGHVETSLHAEPLVAAPAAYPPYAVALAIQDALRPELDRTHDSEMLK